MATTHRIVRCTADVLSALTGLAETLPSAGPVAEAVLTAAAISLTTVELSLAWIDRDRLVPAKVKAYRATNAASSACTS